MQFRLYRIRIAIRIGVTGKLADFHFYVIEITGFTKESRKFQRKTYTLQNTRHKHPCFA
jgi:hypothetical protein